jgi:hypothetical protein
MKYVCASDSLRPGQLDRLISTIKDETPSKEKSIMQGHIMQSYIGCKFIQAEPMDECAFLEKEKGQDCFGRVTRAGYKVVYPDGYISWSPKDVFEEAYRPILKKEKLLISAPEQNLP